MCGAVCHCPSWKMGGTLALNASRAGFEIIGVDPKGVPQELARSGVIPATMAELKLFKPTVK